MARQAQPIPQSRSRDLSHHRRRLVHQLGPGELGRSGDRQDRNLKPDLETRGEHAMRNIVRNRSSITLIAVVGVVALLAGGIPASAAPPLPGAIFTTNSTCTGVDLNIYADKADVFLNGGPQNHPGAAGLTDGSYYVQVTTPGGTVLGSSVGTPNETPVQVVNGVFSQCYQLASIVATTSSTFTVAGYDDTTNPGGEYKVWVSNESSFVNNSTKTDNFKVRTSGTVTISGKKFYDAALSGLARAVGRLGRLHGQRVDGFEGEVAGDVLDLVGLGCRMLLMS